MILAGFFAHSWLLALLTLDCAKLGGTQNFSSLQEPDVPFPPARPTLQNLAAICHYGQSRPRYPPSFFPRSGVSFFRRCGKAINRLESWYSMCCSGEVAQQNVQILCCAQQAWQNALSVFCVEEFAVMTRAYPCCRKSGETRWSCFNDELPNPFYEPTAGYMAPQMPHEPGFTWKPNAC
ncbi:extracellular matrix protein 1 [Oncorhynchus kisutch]|uniref:extracellular matrix protein 1 n=1 Tax=Oncorhynchus kisutch TaxID=8019 RepID=UPI00099FAFAE|nr:extracellular matrix protein 1 [Oncorhynchus kisutch]